MRSSVTSRYRHELGSLVDVARDGSFAELSPEFRELALHVVAAHHGRARPHFPIEERFDPEARDEEARSFDVDVLVRFANLQRRFGRWGLAYLESLMRAADYAASDAPSAFVQGGE